MKKNKKEYENIFSLLTIVQKINKVKLKIIIAYEDRNGIELIFNYAKKWNFSQFKPLTKKSQFIYLNTNIQEYLKNKEILLFSISQ